MSDPTGMDAARVAEVAEAKARGAFTRYKVMAYVTGCMLLLLTFEMVAKYAFNHGEGVLGTWVAIVHGWIYVIYAITVFSLWSTMRWGIGRIAALILGGIVPLLSFVMEWRAARWFEADLPDRVTRAVRLAEARGRSRT